MSSVPTSLIKGVKVMKIKGGFLEMEGKHFRAAECDGVTGFQFSIDIT